MRGAWRPGGLWDIGLSPKIPGFASPPFDGFALFQTESSRQRPSLSSTETQPTGAFAHFE